MFDPQAFLNQSAGVALSTRLDIPNEGDYLFRCDEMPEFTSFQGKKDPSKTYYQMTIKWKLCDQAELQRLGRDNVTCRERFFVDVGPNGLDFSKGKNIRLGQVYEALGMNDGSGTPARIVGGMVIGQVKHIPNEKNPAEPYAEVVRVTKA